MMVLVEQVSALIDYLETYPNLARGHYSRTHEGRIMANRQWAECAHILNSLSTGCPQKTPAGWRAFFNEYKSKLGKKLKSQLRGQGDGPKLTNLTPLQDRLYKILGQEMEGTPVRIRNRMLRVTEEKTQADATLELARATLEQARATATYAASIDRLSASIELASHKLETVLENVTNAMESYNHSYMHAYSGSDD